MAITATLHGLHWLGLTAQSGTFTGLGTSAVPYIAGGANATTTASNGLSYASVSPTSALPDRTGVAPTYSVAATIPIVGARAV